MQRPVVDLPQPDSPTSPSVSPRCDGEATAVHRVDAPDLARQQAALDGKMLDEIADAQQGLALRGRRVEVRRQDRSWRLSEMAGHAMAGAISRSSGSRSLQTVMA